MQRRHIALMLALGASTWLAVVGDKTPDADIVDSVARRSTLSDPPSARTKTSAFPSEKRKGSAKVEPIVRALQPRETLIGGMQSEKGSERLFSVQSWTPPPPPPPKAPPPPPPSAPPLPFTYLGKKMEAGLWEIFLARGEQTLILHEGSEIDGTYRVESIKPPVLSLIYLPLKQTQTMAIGGTE